jgi:hypothetical protein
MFSRRALTFCVLFLIVVLASAQEEVPAAPDTSPEHVPADQDAKADEGETAEGEDVPEDQHDECYDWAEDGDCEENEDFMYAECATSCEARQNCAEWADAGECAENPDFMMDNCASFCDDGDGEDEEEGEGYEEEF